MKPYIFSLLLLFTFANTNAQHWLWVKNSFAGHYQTIASDKNSNIYVHSSFNGTATIGNTTLTATTGKSTYIARYDTLGNAMWAKQILFGNQNVAAQDIAVNAKNDIIVSGVIEAKSGVNHYLAKYDSTGKQIWWRVDNLSGDNLQNFFFSSGLNITPHYKIAIDNYGNSFLTARLHSDIAISGKTIAMPQGVNLASFIIKFDNAGQYLWGYNYYGNQQSQIIANDITVDENGDAIITATATSTDSIFFHNLSIKNAALNGFNHKAPTMILAKYTGIEGKVKWATTNKGSKSNNIGSGLGGVHPNNIATDANNNIYVIGHFRDSSAFDNTILADTNEYDLGASYGLLSDVFLAKYDMNGKEQWAKTVGDTSYSGGTEVAINNNNEVFISNNFGFDLFQQRKQKIAKYDINGNLIWYTEALVNSYNNNFIGSLCTDANHNLYMGGSLFYDITSVYLPLMFGSISLPHNTSNNLYFAKISPNLPNSVTHLNSAKNINIYPNPVNHQLHVETDEVGATITLYNAAGKEVYHAVANSKQHTINTQPFTSGMYILSVTDTNGNTSKKKVTKL